MSRGALSPDTVYKGASGLFVLFALFFVGVTIYEYDLWTRFEAEVAANEARVQASGAEEGFVSITSLYAPLYVAGGKWNVVGVNVMLAILSLAVGATLLWKWRNRHADEERDDSESPVA